jgi:TP901 family phage tail tape measure protein
MRDSILQLGVDYGTVFANVQDISLRWTQAGYNVADTLELTKTSLLAMNTAELDAEKSTVGFIAIMSQWGLESKDLLPTLDKINKVGDDFAVTSQDLVDGLTRASGAAKVMGLSLDQTIGLLTTMREASGRTGRETGNALNSILSYIQRPGSIKIMESMGISMFADQAKTQFRNVMEVFSELAAKWNDPSLSSGIKDALMAGAQEAGLFSQELADATGTQYEYAKAVQATTEAQGQFNDVEKRDAAQAAAGIYRRNYFIGLLERFATVSQVQLSIDKSSGYSAREKARTMETLENKY